MISRSVREEDVSIVLRSGNSVPGVFLPSPNNVTYVERHLLGPLVLILHPVVFPERYRLLSPLCYLLGPLSYWQMGLFLACWALSLAVNSKMQLPRTWTFSSLLPVYQRRKCLLYWINLLAHCSQSNHCGTPNRKVASTSSSADASRSARTLSPCADVDVSVPFNQKPLFGEREQFQSNQTHLRSVARV